jgi:hypothetical protein
MPVASRTFWLPRRGNTRDEYEDAFALDEASGRYAVADGATEGCFTGLWARMLVEDFVAGAQPDASLWPSSLRAAQGRWDADVRSRKLDWDADHWVEQGASAAFLGIRLTDSAGRVVLENSAGLLGERPRVRASYQWQAVAVGDTCLFHTRDSALLRAFPLDRSDQFNNRPRLVGSRMPLGEIHKRQRLWTDGCGQPGDRLWAMTDALAKWCLAEHEAGNNPWHELESLPGADPSLPSPGTDRRLVGRGAGGEGDSFTAWIKGLRESGRLLNDDVTLLAIRL